jgi:hypothetical protein
VRKRLLLLCLILSSSAATVADTRTRSSSYLTLYVDNDLFGGTDRNYTNGLRLSWISPATQLHTFIPLRKELEDLAGVTGDYRFLRAISGFNRDSVEAGTLELNYGLSLTQLIFTPKDAQSEVQPPGERRYAGWLGLGFSVHARDERAMNSAELILGTTGPRSLARQSQNLIHDVRNIEKFSAWNEQVPNELTADLSFIQKRRLPIRDGPGMRVDGFSEWGVRLGSMQTTAHFGTFIRAGINLPADFSDPRLSPTAYSHKFFSGGSAAAHSLSYFGLFGAGAHGVAHDATLDGPLFDSFKTGNRREPWYGEMFAGFAVRWRSVELSYVHTWRSRTFREEESYTEFGSLALRLEL